MVYKCPRCGYTSNIKTHIVNHFKRKMKCDAKLSNISIEESFKQVLGYETDEVNVNKRVKLHICKFCQKSFSNRQGKYQHERNKRCSNERVAAIMELANKEAELENKEAEIGVKDKELEIKDKELEIKDKELENKDSELANKEAEIDDLKKQVEMLKCNKVNTLKCNKVNTQIMGDQINIIINAFGEEDMRYITPEKIKNLIMRGPMYSVPKLLQDIHFNKEHNENHNIYIPNKKLPYAKIYDGDKWVLTKKKEAIEDMTNKAFNLISDTDGIDKKISQIREDYENGDKKTINRLKDDTELMILNNQISIEHP